MLAARTYVPDVRPEGTTASSKGFSQREQAEEGQFIRKREIEKLKAAEEKLKAAQAEVVCAVPFPSYIVSAEVDSKCPFWPLPSEAGNGRVRNDPLRPIEMGGSWT